MIKFLYLFTTIMVLPSGEIHTSVNFFAYKSYEDCRKVEFLTIGKNELDNCQEQFTSHITNNTESIIKELESQEES